MGRQSVLFSLRIIVLVGVLALGGFLLCYTMFPRLLFAVTGWVTVQQVSWRFDVSDARRLVGAADHVFVGRVITQVGSEGLPTTIPNDSNPRTQFAVDVVSTIKGNVTGTIVVNQDAGFQHGALVLVDGDALLQPGELYVFVTSWNKKDDWHHIIAPGYANIRVNDRNELATLEAKFRTAVQEEIPDPEKRLDEPEP